MNGIYNLGLEKFLSSLGMRGFVGVWRPLTCGNRPVPNRKGVAKFTRSEERGRGFVLRKFQQAELYLSVAV